MAHLWNESLGQTLSGVGAQCWSTCDTYTMKSFCGPRSGKCSKRLLAVLVIQMCFDLVVLWWLIASRQIWRPASFKAICAFWGIGLSQANRSAFSAVTKQWSTERKTDGANQFMVMMVQKYTLRGFVVKGADKAINTRQRTVQLPTWW